MTTSIEQLLENLSVLESHLGEKIKYHILDPFPVKLADIISIQEAAKKIASFVGLSGLTFIIGIAKQEDKVGGHIELSEGNQQEVFIELSEGILKYPETTLSTLAHEITHKYLQVNGIKYPDNRKNEILTDTAAVYLGLGKIMLNGCERHNTKHESDWQGEHTTTETLTTGYLDRESLAFIHILICTMRKLSKKRAESELLHDSKETLNNCREEYNQYFDKAINNKKNLIFSAEKLATKIKNLQHILSHIEKNCLYIQKGGIPKIERFLEKHHKQMMSYCCGIEEILGRNSVNPSLAYLNTIISRHGLLKNKDNIAEVILEARFLEKTTKKIVNIIKKDKSFPKPAPEMFDMVTCWNDMIKLRLPRNKHNLTVKCPKCNYQFVADTSIKRIKLSFLVTIKSLLRNIGRKICSFYQ